MIAVSGAGFPQGMEPSIRLRVAPPRLRLPATPYSSSQRRTFAPFFTTTERATQRKTAGKRAVGELANHLIIDSTAFRYTPMAPQPSSFKGQGHYDAKNTAVSFLTMPSHRIRQACYSPEPGSPQVQIHYTTF